MGGQAVFTTEFWQEVLRQAIIAAWAILRILIVFVILRFLANRVVDRVIHSIERRESVKAIPLSPARAKTLGTLIKSVIFYVLIFVAGIMVLRVFKVDVAPVLTAAGVVGLAVGFGAQKLVRDIVSGFFVVLENQYVVGEQVTIGGVTGKVEEIGMRTTQLRDEKGNLIIVPNGDVSNVVNHSRTPT